MAKRAGKANYTDLSYVFLYGIAFAILGAVLFRTLTKLPSVFWNIELWKQQTVEHFFTYLFGEYVFYGGLLGGLLGIYIYTRKYKLLILKYLDLFAAPVAFAHALGRVGCYFGGCCYGIEVEHDHPLAIIYPEYSLAAPPGIPLLNVPIMEAVFLALLGGLLTVIFLRAKKPGLCAATYLLAYSVWRFIIEFFRGDLIRGKLGLFSTSQYVSLAIVISVIVFFVLSRRKKETRP
ncbi:diacylglyceryl transferase [Clostridia bacterium]|nr:diacylglyceryl transferase [Clostridia bacterium]